MSDQKKPPVPSFEDLQKAAQPDPRLAKTAPHAPNPLLVDQTRPPRPLGPTTPGSRLDPEMLQRLAQSGLAGDPRYGPGPNAHPKPPTGEERTVQTRAPNAPAAAPRPPNPPATSTPAAMKPASGPPSAHLSNAPLAWPMPNQPVPPPRAPSIPPAPAARAPAIPPAPNVPRAPTPVTAAPTVPPGAPSNVPAARAPSIPAAPASLAPARPPPAGPPPRVPPPPPANQPVARAPSNPPPAVGALPNATRAPAPAPAANPFGPPGPPAPPSNAPRAPASMPSIAAVPLPPLRPPPVTARPSNAPPAPQYSPSIAKTGPMTPASHDDALAPTSIKPAPHPPPTRATSAHDDLAPTSVKPAPQPPPARAASALDELAPTSIRPATQDAPTIKPAPASRVAINPDEPTGISPTVVKAAEPATSRVAAASVEPPTSLQRPPTSRPPAAQATGNPTLQMSRAELANQFKDSEAPTTPRMPAVAPNRSPQPKLPDAHVVEERTPVHVPVPMVTTEPQPLSFAVSDSNTPLPHLDRPPSLNSKSLLDVSPVLAPTPAVRSPTVNLRPPAVSPDAIPTPPRPPPGRAPPAALLDFPPEEGTPVRLSKAFAVTQPGTPGPFAGKRPLATPGPLPPVPELTPTTDAGGLEPVTSDDHGPALRSSLGEAYDPEQRSDVQRVPVVESKPQLVAAPASLIRRCLAFTVDFALVGASCLGLLYAFSLVKGVKAVPPNLAPLDVLLFRMHGLDKLLLPALGACALVALAYSTFFAMALQGRTPGRLLSGVRLVTSNGETPGPVRAVLRAMLGFVSFGLFLSGFWLALFDRKGQTLHDKLTRTFVVRPL